jgi:hypothetical protein
MYLEEAKAKLPSELRELQLFHLSIAFPCQSPLTTLSGTFSSYLQLFSEYEAHSC